jgi:hypothetical protein
MFAIFWILKTEKSAKKPATQEEKLVLQTRLYLTDMCSDAFFYVTLSGNSLTLIKN